MKQKVELIIAQDYTLDAGILENYLMEEKSGLQLVLWAIKKKEL